jgi:hypothetical protein
VSGKRGACGAHGAQLGVGCPQMEDQWTAAAAAAQYLGYGITVAERHHADVPKPGFSAAFQRMLSDPVVRKLVPAFVSRCVTPELLWGHLRSKATGSGSWEIPRSCVSGLKAVPANLARASRPSVAGREANRLRTVERRVFESDVWPGCWPAEQIPLGEIAAELAYVI